MTTEPQTERSYLTRLQRILNEEGRRQSWLAEQVGLDQGELSRIVRGLHASQHKRQAIADALGRTTADVFPEPEDRAA